MLVLPEYRTILTRSAKVVVGGGIRSIDEHEAQQGSNKGKVRVLVVDEMMSC